MDTLNRITKRIGKVTDTFTFQLLFLLAVTAGIKELLVRVFHF